MLVYGNFISCMFTYLRGDNLGLHYIYGNFEKPAVYSYLSSVAVGNFCNENRVSKKIMGSYFSCEFFVMKILAILKI